MVNLKSLRDLADKATQAAKERTEAKEEAKARRDWNLAARNELAAKHVLERLEMRAQRHAQKGLRSCKVMPLRYLKHYKNLTTVRPADLIGVAKLVWDELDKQKLKVRLNDWHDGVGIKSGWDMVLEW